MQAVRYLAAVILAPIIGEIVGIPLAFALDIVWNGSVTGGTWALTAPNVILIILKSLIAGYAAGYIAVRQGALIGAISNFSFPVIVLTVAAFLQFAVPASTSGPAWIVAAVGLIPAIIGGALGSAGREAGLGQSLMGMAAGIFILAQIGAAAIHLYTIIIAYQSAGFFPALVTLLMPLLAEVYWLYQSVHLSGSFFNPYSMRIALLLIWSFIGIGLAIWGSASDEKRKISDLMSKAKERAGRLAT